MFTIPPVSTLKKGELLPLINRLNGGPDLTEIVHSDHRERLPKDWKISFGNVSPVTARVNTGWLTQLAVEDFAAFLKLQAGICSSKIKATQVH